MPVQALLIVPLDDDRAERPSVRLDADRPRTIGRSRSSDIVLASAAVSGAHARVRIEDGRLLVADAGSRNGTWLVRGEEERRLDDGEEVAVDSGSAIRIGPFQLVPCELLGDGVVLTSHAELGDVTVTTPAHETAGTDDSPVRAAALAALVRALNSVDPAAAPRSTWDAALRGLLELTGAERGFLLSRSADRFLLRAGRGDGSISRAFLEMTAKRAGAWDFVPTAVEGGKASASIGAYGPDVVLTGVPLRSSAGETIAVAHLERPSAAANISPGLVDEFAIVAGRLLELAEALDRETRRREALEGREASRLPRAGTAAVPRRRVALVGNDPLFRHAVETVERAAASGAHLLIRGPSGSGKEQLAQLAHEAGERHEQPFVVLNCAALPESLVESELFGADKGAYTGADRSRAGAFEQADGGTLFLDEIGDLPLAAQAKILRVIETGEVVRVGGSRRQVDVRLVTATHRDLEAMVGEGTFREDLYYRLRVIEVSLPALAERRDDVLALAEHFLSRARRPDGASVRGISVRAGTCLRAWAWPGNVRELRNVVERAVVLDRDGVVDLDDLPAEIRGAAVDEATGASGGFAELLALPWPEAKERFEASYFRSALARHGGAVQETARATGVDRRTLSTKIARHGLKKADD